MIFTDDFFFELDNRNELKDFPSLLILDLPKVSDLKLGNLTPVEDTKQIYVFATIPIADGNLKIKNDTKFDVIFSRKNPLDFEECDAIMKYVNVNPRYEIDYLPGGSTGVCLLEFANKKPNILQKLGYHELKNHKENDMLILTQKEVFQKLINKLKGR